MMPRRLDTHFINVRLSSIIIIIYNINIFIILLLLLLFIIFSLKKFEPEITENILFVNNKYFFLCSMKSTFYKFYKYKGFFTEPKVSSSNLRDSKSAYDGTLKR